MTEPTKRGTGWIIFAGVVMIIAGANMFINGLWALNASDEIVVRFNDTLLFSDTNLDTWGWIYTIVGVAVLLAGDSSSSDRRGPAGSASSRRRSRRSSPSSGCSRPIGPGRSSSSSSTCSCCTRGRYGERDDVYV